MDENNILNNEHYVAMYGNNREEGSYSFPKPTSTIESSSQRQPDFKSTKRGSLVLPQAPKTQIKKKGE